MGVALGRIANLSKGLAESPKMEGWFMKANTLPTIYGLEIEIETI